jgi:nucleoside-diphosphate-sugar epimerase
MIKDISILGCGWLGLPLGHALVEEGYVVRGSTTSKDKGPVIKSNGIEPYLLKVGEEIKGEHLDLFFQSDLIIINIPPGGRRDSNVVRSYPHKISLILDRVNSSTIKHILFVSSTGVYGDMEGIATESSPTAPNSLSGQAVLQAEQILVDSTFSKLTILRMAGLVGGERKAGRFLAGKKNLPNGSAPVNVVHLADCIGVIKAIIRQGAWGEVFNVSADEHPQKSIFYTEQAKKLGLEPPTFIDKLGHHAKMVSNTKLKKYLDYQFVYSNPMDF